MRFFRYIGCALLIAGVLIISCDLFQIYLYDFEDFYQTSFYVQNSIDTETMKKQIYATAKDYDITVLYIDKIIEGNYSTHLNIYCDETTAEYLTKKYYLKQGIYKSAFSGSATIAFHPFSELTSDAMKRKPTGYYMLGSLENARACKASLVDTYGGSIPRPSDRNSRQEIIKKLLLIWLAAGGVILLLTLYRTVRLRKELLIRLSLGESLLQIVLLNIITDAVWYAVCCGVTISVIYKVYHFLFLASFSIGALILLIICNALIYLSLLHYDLKLGFSNSKLSRKLLLANYVLKVILTFALSVSIASGIAFIFEFLKLDKQKEFYESRQEYSYLQLVAGEEKSYLETYFYKKYFQEFDIQFSCGSVMYNSKKPFDLAICMNANLCEYLCDNLTSVAQEIRHCKACILIPEGLTLTDEELSNLTSSCCRFSDLEASEVDIIYYSDSAHIINYNVYQAYSRTKCPVILFNNCMENNREYTQDRILPQLNFGRAMQKLDMEELETFCEENQCGYVIENVYLQFEHDWVNMQRGAMLNLVLLFFQCILEGCLIVTTMRLEFENNRLEIVLKKILGYSILERMGKPILLTAASGMAGMAATIIAYIAFDFDYTGYTCASIAIIMFLEFVSVFFVFSKAEKTSIQKTLKGGFL